jgi:hypothetical protein
MRKRRPALLLDDISGTALVHQSSHGQTGGLNWFLARRAARSACRVGACNRSPHKPSTLRSSELIKCQHAAGSDQGFVAKQGCFHECAFPLADHLLPACAALLLDPLHVPITRTARGLRSRARHSGGPRRNHHHRRRLRLTFREGAVDRLGVVRAISSDGGNRTRNLVEQGADPDPREIADLVARSLRGEDLPTVGLDRQMKLAPGPATTRAVLPRLPLPSAVDLQPGGIDHHVDRPGRWRQWSGQRETDAAPGKGGVVGNREAHPEQGRDRAQEAFGWPSRSMKSQTQQMHRLDGHIRVVRGAAALARLPCLPSRQRFGRDPQVKLPRACQAWSYSRPCFTWYRAWGSGSAVLRSLDRACSFSGESARRYTHAAIFPKLPCRRLMHQRPPAVGFGDADLIYLFDFLPEDFWRDDCFDWPPCFAGVTRAVLPPGTA